jgi:hypothetical protein
VWKGFEKRRDWERSAGELNEQTPIAKMAKAEESFPNWEQN